MELAGLTDGNNVGVRKREIQDHTHVLDFEILGRCWCHLIRQGKLEKSRTLGVNKWEIRKSVSYMLLLHIAFYTFFSLILSLLFQLYQKRSKMCWQIHTSHGFMQDVKKISILISTHPQILKCAYSFVLFLPI